MTKVRIAGLDVHVVSPEEAEGSAYVVCCVAGMPSPFPDNVETTCATCGRAIFHRPDVPKTPPKICLGCAVEMSGSTRQ